jgi:murein L,D-transpeptidase YafK
MRFALVGLLLVTACDSSEVSATCGDKSTHIFVATEAHELRLCESGSVQRSYGVRLGKGGLGKTREGDGKVPLGAYAIRPPRPSSLYGTFIPIEYPTKEQREQGYTGSAVGVHGPHRSAMWLGRLVNVLDTTDGCVGLATDEEMSEIGAWMSRTGAARIVID